VSDPAGAAALEAVVSDFVDGLAPDVEALGAAVAGIDRDRLRMDVVVEAYNLTCAFVDADGLHTDDELWALIAVFGPRIGGDLAAATPAHVREAALVTGRRTFLERPSTMLEVLAGADRRDAGARTDRYARLGARIGHTVAALDLVPSRTELSAIESFRATVHALGSVPAGIAARAAAGTPATPGPDVPEPTEPARPLADLLAELDALIGMDGVKHEVHLVTNLLRVQQIRHQRGLPVMEQSRHLIFTGNPGTGKTTVARLLAQIYRTLGVVEKGHLVESDRSALVAGFVGQTATRVVAAFDRADGGVLLIDEAYSLARGGADDFGKEAIDTLVKLVEDRRDRLVVILAGYPDEMASLVDANPGMRSRFPKTIHFPDYDDDELFAIFETLCGSGRYTLDADARAAMRAWLAAQPRDRGFGNGRMARNLFEAAVANQATRFADVDQPSDEQLTTLTAADIPPVTSPASAARGAPTRT
jgi:AAA lid domain/ATPase family associated with various cellular activities (AAA)